MPKFPDILLNNNPNAPSLDLNNLQVKGVGIFADAAARDALDSNLHTEGYLAIMKDTDTPFIYTGGTWTDAANWKEVKGVWEEVAGTSTKITYEQGTVGIKAAASVFPGHSTNQNFLGSTFPSDSGGRGAGTLLHLHEGKLTVSTAATTATSMFELVNPQHSLAAGGAIGLSGYNLRVHGYHAIEFNHGSSFGTSSNIVYMDHPSSAANIASIAVGAVNNGLGGINLPSFGPLDVDTTNYSISMGGRIIFRNHSNIFWDAITQGPGTHQNAGVSLSSFNSHDILVAVSSDSTTPGSYGYVGINSYSPSASGPAFEVSSSYGKFNTGLRVANSASIATMQVQGGQVLFTSIADGIWLQSVYNTTAGVSIGYQALASGGPGSVAIGNQLRSPNEGTVVLGYAPQAMTGWTAADPRSVLIGHSAGMTATTASDIIAIGNGPLGTLTSGSGNIALGRQAGSLITTESRNVFIGYEAGRLTTGGYNVFIGNEAGENETGSNRLYISNSDTATPLIYGEFDNNLCRVNGNFQRVVFGSTETTTSGTIHIRDNTDWSTQADATNNTASTGLLGIALGATADVGLVLFGDVDYTITGNVGTPVYLDTTAGGFTTTAPTGSGNIVRVMGHIIGSNKIFFNPSNDWLEIV